MITTVKIGPLWGRLSFPVSTSRRKYVGKLYETNVVRHTKYTCSYVTDGIWNLQNKNAESLAPSIIFSFVLQESVINWCLLNSDCVIQFQFTETGTSVHWLSSSARNKADIFFLLSSFYLPSSLFFLFISQIYAYIMTLFRLLKS
jgi:hypothetical protein